MKRTRLLTNNLWGIGYKEAFPYEYIEEILPIKFETLNVKGMKCAKEWLTIRYGDYMKIPPVSQRENHSLLAWRVK